MGCPHGKKWVLESVYGPPWKEGQNTRRSRPGGGGGQGGEAVGEVLGWVLWGSSSLFWPPYCVQTEIRLGSHCWSGTEPGPVSRDLPERTPQPPGAAQMRHSVRGPPGSPPCSRVTQTSIRTWLSELVFGGNAGLKHGLWVSQAITGPSHPRCQPRLNGGRC